MMAIEEELDFSRGVAKAEQATRRAMYTEPDDRKFLLLVRALDAMYAGALRSGLSRADKSAETYASKSYVDAAAHQHARTIFALARYQSDDKEICRVWMGDTEVRDHGEGMRQGFYIMKLDGDFKIVTHLYICDGCLGAGTREDESECRMCESTGWLHDGGMEWPDLGQPLELHKLEAPSDKRYQRGYEAIGTLPSNFPDI
jgi:hypothetical protein